MPNLPHERRTGELRARHTGALCVRVARAKLASGYDNGGFAREENISSLVPNFADFRVFPVENSGFLPKSGEIRPKTRIFAENRPISPIYARARPKIRFLPYIGYMAPLDITTRNGALCSPVHRNLYIGGAENRQNM